MEGFALGVFVGFVGGIAVAFLIAIWKLFTYL